MGKILPDYALEIILSGEGLIIILLDKVLGIILPGEGLGHGIILLGKGLGIMLPSERLEVPVLHVHCTVLVRCFPDKGSFRYHYIQCPNL
jgi:hypothetical protein